MNIVLGIPEAHRQEAAELYEQAFGQKFAAAIPSQEKRLILMREALDLQFAFGALANKRLLGLAGFSTANGALTRGITFTLLRKTLGFIPALRAALVFSLYERKAKPNELLMDGISVHVSSRGHGVGTRLLNALCEHGAGKGYQSVRLDVIDTNDAARRLYEREGFVATHTETFEFLRKFLGFGAATTLVRQLTHHSPKATQ